MRRYGVGQQTGTAEEQRRAHLHTLITSCHLDGLHRTRLDAVRALDVLRIVPRGLAFAPRGEWRGAGRVQWGKSRGVGEPSRCHAAGYDVPDIVRAKQARELHCDAVFPGAFLRRSSWAQRWRDLAATHLHFHLRRPSRRPPDENPAALLAKDDVEEQDRPMDLRPLLVR